MLTTNLDVTMSMVGITLLATILAISVALMLVKPLARLTHISGPLLIPFLLLLLSIGAFTENNSWTDVLFMLGFVAIGIACIQSTKVGGTYPLVGWAIVVACAGAAIVFVRRALARSVQARVDSTGVYSRRLGPDAVPWADISGFHVLAAGIQRIARFERRDGRTFGINTTFYDRGIAELAEAVRQARPDLGA